MAVHSIGFLCYYMFCFFLPLSAHRLERKGSLKAVAEQCCEETWEYKGKSYNKCANTDYGVPWCVVNEKCAKKHFLGGWAFCHADNALSEQPSACTCRPKWKFKGTQYEGCARTTASEPRWCYVSENCLGAKDPDEEEAEGYKWAYCSAAGARCCQHRWVFNGRAYRDCANTGSGYPWCYVKSSSCPGATQVANSKAYWAYCHMDLSTGPTESDCTCKKSWKFGHETKSGCAQTDAGAEWCYVTDPNCEGAKISALNKKDAFAYCKKIDVSCCASTWVYYDKIYKGCTSTDTNHPWCRVTHPECKSTFSAQKFGNLWGYCFADGTTDTEPGDCSCQLSTWEHKDKKYYGCDRTDPGEARRCYVESSSCKGAVRSGKGEDSYWAYCALSATPCCDKQWTHHGKSYTGCSDTGWASPWCPSSKEGCPHATKPAELMNWAYCHADQSTSADETDCECESACTKEDEGPAWCYVKHSCCKGAKPEHATGKSWMYCKLPCACEAKWEFKGNTYSGCTKTDIRDPWCYVNDACTIGMESENNSITKRWAYCYADGSLGTEKTDCTCADLWTFNNTEWRGCAAFAFHAPSWCMVTDPMCKGAMPGGSMFQSIGIIEGPWNYCGNPHVHCCKKEWTYDGKKYHGCHRFDDEWGAWCVVESPDCPGAMVFDDSEKSVGQKYDASHHWAYCYVNGETNSEPSQCQCDTPCTDGFCYMHEKCLGGRASQLTAGLFYALCPAKGFKTSKQQEAISGSGEDS